MGDGPSETKTTDTKTDPWAPQQPYLTGAFSEAQKAYDKNMAQGAYSGDYVAAPSQQQYDAYGNAVTQAQAGQGAVSGMLQTGADALNAGTAGQTAAVGALNQFGNSDITGQNIDSAQRYVAGLDIPGAVKAGMLTANQNATENAMPGLDRAAAGSGGINSDRNALSQGIVERGLAQQAAGLSSTMTNQAYTTGLDQAAKGNTAQVAALNAAGSNGAYLSNAGNGAITGGINDQASLNTQATGGANGATGLDQSTLNNLMAKYNGGQQFTSQQLQNLMAIVGKPYGSQTSGTQTTQTDPSMMQNIGSGVGIAAALFCDRVIKDVYGLTGGTWRGFPEYLFSYKLDAASRLHRGPMAQDVELTHPHAVTTIGGIKVILTDLI